MILHVIYHSHLYSGGEFQFSLVDDRDRSIVLGQSSGLLLANRAGSSKVGFLYFCDHFTLVLSLSSSNIVLCLEKTPLLIRCKFSLSIMCKIFITIGAFKVNPNII